MQLDRETPSAKSIIELKKTKTIKKKLSTNMKAPSFSKLSKLEKIEWLAQKSKDPHFRKQLTRFWHPEEKEQKLFDEFSENTLSNYYLPFGVAPHFVINGESYDVPMVIEESSVVAAAANAAKFWSTRGGFTATVSSMTKVGQVHFLWQGKKSLLENYFQESKNDFFRTLAPLTEKMEKRGGGVLDLKLIDKTSEIENYYQLYATFNTCDAMGANFINTCLEELSEALTSGIKNDPRFTDCNSVKVIMSILSNYTPECKVTATVTCAFEELDNVIPGMPGFEYAEKFATAVEIANSDINRAVTHNKGIMNGIDAVVLATGNDFRAVEACAHAYASSTGKYKSLSQVSLKDHSFAFTLEMPLAIGTVGGLTSLHPLSKTSLAMLKNPDAETLMKIVACVGLAQNFGAIRSLTTTGIQRGHMKMHLMNILNSFGATEIEVAEAKAYFTDKVVSYQGVEELLKSMRAHH
ncbi:MAG: hydroxymethylglutaryl-CoA reductase, degradative [Bacteriovoracaceae bacterium]